MPRLFKLLLPLFCLLPLAVQAAPEGHLPPKVAVAGLGYEERVSEYFRVVAAKEKSSFRASERERESESDARYAASRRASASGKSESEYFEAEGTYSYIERGELNKFTADIRGEMIKAGAYRLVQGKPYAPTGKNENIHDIIGRIKAGYYPGADYVLVGTINSLQFRDEANPVIGTHSVSATLSLELVAEFSLVNTKTFEIKAAFSAMGEGQDAKLLSSRGTRVVLNRGKVVSEVSKSLGADVARQLEEQLGGGRRGEGREMTSERGAQTTEVIIFK